MVPHDIVVSDAVRSAVSFFVYDEFVESVMRFIEKLDLSYYLEGK